MKEYLAVESEQIMMTPQGGHFALRSMRKDDIHAVYLGLSNPKVIAHYGISFESLEATRAQMDWFAEIEREGSGRWWALCDPAAPERLLGACGFNNKDMHHKTIELGYWLLPEQWGRGIVRECLPVALDYAFARMGVHRVEAVVELANTASLRVLEAAGFHYEGTKRDCEWKNGQPLSLRIYSRLATDP